MSTLESPAIGEKDAKTEHSSRKRVRHRKKLVYEKIMKQMEFYFSDANLAKDRYLGQLLKEDDYVPLETFLTFNKIREMTNDVTDIVKAMKHSELLQLSEDKSKVKRTQPPAQYDSESRTVYVESIPVSANREWLERIFKEYGPVAYISLPKFKDSQHIKGYGFVEFQTEEDAQKCITVFTERGCRLPTTTAPAELSSVKTFEICPESVVQEPLRKKPRHPEPALLEEPSQPLTVVPIGVRDPNHPADEHPPRDKPRRGTDGALGLQVLPKREWKKLRNQYLTLQRKRAKPRAGQCAPPAAPAPAANPAHLRFDDDDQ